MSHESIRGFVNADEEGKKRGYEHGVKDRMCSTLLGIYIYNQGERCRGPRIYEVRFRHDDVLKRRY